ncbi:protein kinase superfamily protein [Wolffia australiana]
MSDEVLMQLSSNSNPSDSNLPIKIAKLEARMVGKATSSNPAQSSASIWQSGSSVKFGQPEELSDPSTSSESDNDAGEEFLILANTQKRRRTDDEVSAASQLSEEAVDVRAKIATDGSNKGKQGRGRGRASNGRGRGSKSNESLRLSNSSTPSIANGHLDSASLKENRTKDVFGSEEKASLQEEISTLRAKISSLEEELAKSRQESLKHQQLYYQLDKELKDLREHDRLTKIKRIKVLSDLLIAVSKAERQEARIKTQQESTRLGNVGVVRAGTVVSETWEDGQAIKDISAHLRSLLESKESIERYRKTLRKRQSDKGDGAEESVLSEEDFLIQDEICKSRLASIKREEDLTMREKDRYEVEKGRLIREMKRIRDEDGSRFNSFPILHNRYALMNLLGKGGFSEVYKAFDLVDYRYVACKLHGLNPQWSEEKKKSYIRHATREYDIHKTLLHPHIVRLWDIFEIDNDTFCTVLEFCSGKDLDAVLKATPILLEREARIIMVQIFQGLVYLNKRPQKIIHYDLKPGNVLFDELGIAKLTDFGLSKIVEDDVGSQGVELTSQGAGTYWYLPPECFECHKTPLISSKVDVWSVGVILYQMLFGRRPFGHDQSQERILREATIVNARKVDFPSRPTVSNEAKDLIRRCLTYNQLERPDVLTLAQDPYFSYSKK